MVGEDPIGQRLGKHRELYGMTSFNILKVITLKSNGAPESLSVLAQPTS
jgi:hypothetical protein